MPLSEKSWHLGVPKTIGAKMLDGVLRIGNRIQRDGGSWIPKTTVDSRGQGPADATFGKEKYVNRLAVSIWTNLRASVAAVNAGGNRPKGFISFRNFIVLVFVVVAILVLPATAFSS
ncbi:hypothetical protein PENFLA_c011G07330 [Penicillium flavigenum]|uniref:Uncharacterized protein n=1 Tax=Penicillium flavigenum TaxID=254877 RepID=A0A1V6TBX7_9EURO|nr:hypothetical protein PENFLA_c011G07330 [Penicillium flavigenum]